MRTNMAEESLAVNREGVPVHDTCLTSCAVVVSLFRAMNYEKITVESYSGYRVNERPMAFTYHGRRREIQEILDRWYEGNSDAARPVIHYFKVKTTEGGIFILRYLSRFDSWSIGL